MKDGKYALKPNAMYKAETGKDLPWGDDMDHLRWLEVENDETYVLNTSRAIALHLQNVTPNMFLGEYFEYGEEIEVRNSESDEWGKDIFLNYNLNPNVCPFSCKRSYWQYARKLQKPSLEATHKDRINKLVKSVKEFCKQTNKLFEGIKE